MRLRKQELLASLWKSVCLGLYRNWLLNYKRKPPKGISDSWLGFWITLWRNQSCFPFQLLKEARGYVLVKLKWRKKKEKFKRAASCLNFLRHHKNFIWNHQTITFGIIVWIHFTWTYCNEVFLVLIQKDILSLTEAFLNM